MQIKLLTQSFTTALVTSFPMYDSHEWTNPSDFEEIAHLMLIFPGSV